MSLAAITPHFPIVPADAVPLMNFPQTTEFKAYPLPIVRSYVRHWKLREAIRELIQNALDHDSPFEFSFADEVLTITSRRAFLEPKTLLLGSTSKADDAEKIGSFGEGYKLALLVLTREGYPVRLLNGPYEWTPAFVHSEVFGEEVLVINERRLGSDTQAVEFQIGNIDAEAEAQVREMCLRMQPIMKDVIGVPQGHILPSRPGKLYVSGLYVCETEMQAGYDVKPEYLQLERDRQTVDGFKLKFLAKDMWLASKEWDLIYDLLERDAPDMELIQYESVNVPTALAEVAGERFATKNEGRIPVATQADAEKYTRSSNTIIASRALSRVVSASSFYATRVVNEVKVKTPQQELEQWLEKNKRYLSRLPKTAFKKLIVQSKEWTVKDSIGF